MQLAAGFHSAADHSPVSLLVSSCQRFMHTLTDRILSHLTSFHTRHHRNHSTVLSTQSRVFWYSLLECIAIVGMALYVSFCLPGLRLPKNKRYLGELTWSGSSCAIADCRYGSSRLSLRGPAGRSRHRFPFSSYEDCYLTYPLACTDELKCKSCRQVGRAPLAL